ncbi:MAG: Gfo/Idh/MocA family oxidoreductase [Deltaproteobacteria bacterium]
MGSTSTYLGGVPEEETIVFDGQDISWELEWKEFTAAIREGREPLGSGRDGLEANRMIAAVYLSAKENRPVKLREM